MWHIIAFPESPFTFRWYLIIFILNPKAKMQQSYENIGLVHYDCL